MKITRALKSPKLYSDTAYPGWSPKAMAVVAPELEGQLAPLIKRLLRNDQHPIDLVLLRRDLRALRHLSMDRADTPSDLSQLLAAFSAVKAKRGSALHEALRRVRSLAAGRSLGRSTTVSAKPVEPILRGIQREIRSRTRGLPEAVRSLLANSRSPRTQHGEATAVRAFAQAGFDPRFDDLRKFVIAVEIVRRTRAPRTAIQYSGCMLRLIRRLRGLDWADEALVKSVIGGLKRSPSNVKVTPPMLIGQVLQIVATIPSDSFAAKRDRVMLLVTFAFGFRVTESCRLKWSQFMLPAGRRLRVSCPVKGSNEQDRVLDVADDFFRPACELVPSLSALLLEWRKELPPDCEYLWPQLDKMSRPLNAPIKPPQFSRIFRDACTAIDISHLRPHSLRAGCITELAKRGNSTLQIARTSGHRTDRMILHYCKLVEASTPTDY